MCNKICFLKSFEKEILKKENLKFKSFLTFTYPPIFVQKNCDFIKVFNQFKRWLVTFVLKKEKTCDFFFVFELNEKNVFFHIHFILSFCVENNFYTLKNIWSKFLQKEIFKKNINEKNTENLNFENSLNFKKINQENFFLEEDKKNPYYFLLNYVFKKAFISSTLKHINNFLESKNQTKIKFVLGGNKKIFDFFKKKFLETKTTETLMLDVINKKVANENKNEGVFLESQKEKYEKKTLTKISQETIINEISNEIYFAKHVIYEWDFMGSVLDFHEKNIQNKSKKVIFRVTNLISEEVFNKTKNKEGFGFLENFYLKKKTKTNTPLALNNFIIETIANFMLFYEKNIHIKNFIKSLLVFFTTKGFSALNELSLGYLFRELGSALLHFAKKHILTAEEVLENFEKSEEDLKEKSVLQVGFNFFGLIKNFFKNFLTFEIKQNNWFGKKKKNDENENSESFLEFENEKVFINFLLDKSTPNVEIYFNSGWLADSRLEWVNVIKTKLSSYYIQKPMLVQPVDWSFSEKNISSKNKKKGLRLYIF